MVSREEAVQILYNCFIETLVIYKKEEAELQVENETTSDSTEYLNQLIDGEKVSCWARDAMAWAIERGIIIGQSKGMIVHGITMTRAEALIVLLKFGC